MVRHLAAVLVAAGVLVAAVALPAASGGKAHPTSSVASAPVATSATDPGAVGPGFLWLEAIFADANGDGGYGRLWVRNSTDTGWNPAGPVAWGNSSQSLIASPDDNAELNLRNTGSESYLYAHKFRVHTTGDVTVTWPSSDDAYPRFLHITSGGVTSGVSTGTEDPTEGLAAPLAALFMRQNVTVGELWVHTGTGDTEWTKVAP